MFVGANYKPLQSFQFTSQADAARPRMTCRQNANEATRSMSFMLFVAYVVAYIFWYVLASAAIDEIAVSEMLPELARNPRLLITPGVFGNSASQLLAVYNAAASVTVIAYLLMRRRAPSVKVVHGGQVVERAHATTRLSTGATETSVFPETAPSQAASVTAGFDADRATLIGICAVAVGLFLLLTGWAWSEVMLIQDAMAYLVAAAATIVAAALWYRWFRIASNDAGEQLRQLASRGFMSGLLTFNNGLFALCAFLTLCVLLSRPFGMMGAYVAVLGVPLAILSYLLVEGWMLVSRMQSRPLRVRQVA